MNRLWCAAFWIITILTGCSSADSRFTLIPLVPSPTAPAPTPTVTVLPPVPTLNPDVLVLQPNQGYGLTLFFDLQPPRIFFYEPRSTEPIFFDLDAQDDDPSNLVLSSEDQAAIPRGMTYVLYAVNAQPEHNRPGSPSVSGTLLRSPDERTLAFFLCNESGGRGQWCDHPRLWLFDMLAGTSTLADFGDSDLLYVFALHFSDDGHTLTGESCLQYANAYFGYCGVSAIMTWDAASGDLLEQTPPKSTGRV